MQTTEKIDRRIRRTRTLLKTSLLDLMEKQPINEITVKELTSIADINRGTFYLHYKDVFGLLEEIEMDLMQELQQVCQKYSLSTQREMPLPLMTDIFLFLGRHTQETSILMGPHGDLTFVNQVKNMIKERCIHDWMQLYKTSDPVYYEYFYSFVVEGCIGLFKTWLETGQKQTPEQMGEIAREMIMGGIHLLA